MKTIRKNTYKKLSLFLTVLSIIRLLLLSGCANPRKDIDRFDKDLSKLCAEISPQKKCETALIDLQLN